MQQLELNYQTELNDRTRNSNATHINRDCKGGRRWMVGGGGGEPLREEGAEGKDKLKHVASDAKGQ